MMRPLIIAASLALVAVAGLAGAAPTPEQKCQDTIANAATKYFGARYKVRSKCEDAQAVAGTPADCTTDPTVVAGLTTATTKLTAKVTARCAPAVLANVELGGACTGAVTTATVVSCITDDVHGARAEELLATAYDSTGQITDALLRTCQKTLAKTLGKDAVGRQKLRRGCAKKFVAGGPQCPDAKAAAKFAKSRDKLIAKVEAKCSDTQVLDAAIKFGAFCGDTRVGAPAVPFSVMTFDRDGVTNNNLIPAHTRLSRCLAAASGVDGDTSADAVYPLPDAAPFSYGVAAGDATPTAFIAWTRADSVAAVTLQVATDAAFTTVVSTSPGLIPNATRDNVVKTEVTGLTAATQYFYRFTQGAASSRVGRIRTAHAVGDTSPMTFAFSGDANAFFKPYALLEGVTAQDPDLFLFFGDTIYGDDPRSGTGAAVVLADYHTKYKENRDDRAMRDVLANVGSASIWDDHEVTNDFYGSPFGAFGPQIIAGNQAFRDYLPMRENGGDAMQLYRSVRWGDVAEFFLTDDRQYRSPQAYVTEPTCLSGGNPVVLPSDPACVAEIADPTRTYLGAAQKAWLKAGLAASTAKWKFIINGPVISGLIFLPYDRWDGYKAERTELLEFIRNPDGVVMTDDHIKNVVVLSTDIHSAIYNLVANPGPAGGSVPEVVAGAIGMDSIYRELPAAVLGLVGSLPSVFPTVQYFDVDRRNYVHVELSTTQAALSYRDNVGSVLKSFTLTAE